MNKFVSNKFCDVCHYIQPRLVEKKVGMGLHYICCDCVCDCVSDFVFDMLKSATQKEIELESYTVEATREGGFTIKPNNKNLISWKEIKV